MFPWNYRPTDPDTDRVEWEDSAVSNSFAWASDTFTTGYCKTPEHWTSKLMHYFWTDCPCCLFLRGVIIGIALGAAGLYVCESALALAYNLLKGL